MASLRFRTWTAALLAASTLAACEGGPQLPFLNNRDSGGSTGTAMSAPSGAAISRDVEAPEVFSTSESALWDGRPSLGGVWVAHPDVRDPERVTIRNPANGEEVIGALFRRERDNPGPKLQVSSDAAAALGMIAGQPADLTVVALKREEVTPSPAATIDTAEDISAASLDDPLASADAALDRAEAADTRPPRPRGAPATAPDALEAALASAAPAPAAPPPQSSSLERPYIQLGIFNVEANATRTGDVMREAGIVPSVLTQDSNGKVFYRVIVGPAQTRAEQRALLEKVQKLGYADAYAVTN